MSKIDYYQCLGISKTANQDEVKQAYRKLALVSMLLHRNIILIKTKTNKKPKSSSHKLPRLILVQINLFSAE